MRDRRSSGRPRLQLSASVVASSATPACHASVRRRRSWVVSSSGPGFFAAGDGASWARSSSRNWTAWAKETPKRRIVQANPVAMTKIATALIVP